MLPPVGQTVRRRLLRHVGQVRQQHVRAQAALLGSVEGMWLDLLLT